MSIASWVQTFASPIASPVILTQDSASPPNLRAHADWLELPAGGTVVFKALDGTTQTLTWTGPKVWPVGVISITSSSAAVNVGTGIPPQQTIASVLLGALGTAVAAASQSVVWATDKLGPFTKAASVCVTLATDLLSAAGQLPTTDEPFRQGVIVTPSDTVDIPNGPARGLRVDVAGTLVFEVIAPGQAFPGGSRNTLTMTVQQGEPIPFYVFRVHTTGTTATVHAGV